MVLGPRRSDGEPGVQVGLGDVPPDVAQRLVRAVDRSPATVVTLMDADLTIRWISTSATWVTGTDPDSRQGASALERIHPDDVERLVNGLAQLRAASTNKTELTAVSQPIRYRFKRFDGRWVVMEATVHNLLGDPVVDGLLVFSRPVSGLLDGVGYVIDLLVAGMPLPEVLGACAGLVPDFLGSAAVVAFLDEGPVAGAVEGSPAERLVADERWWQSARAGRFEGPSRFAGFPDDLAVHARAEGFRTAWTLPIRDQVTGEVVGCVVVWISIDTEPNIAADESLRQAERLASLVIAEERGKRALRRQAVTDPLTGLANRAGLDRRLAGAGDAELSVAVLDLDDFKPVNDRYGHDTGDAVLRVVGQRLRAGLRVADLAARYGGDEFAVVFAPGTDPADAGHTIARIERAIAAPISLGDSLLIRVTASSGLATGRATHAVELADAALYRSKRTRRPGTGH
jgi:diguanylate cyclase (GGDEF)-like protein